MNMNTIWIGASSLAEKLYNKWVCFLGEAPPIIVLDNDRNKKGKPFKGIKIDLVENLMIYLNHQNTIIITSSYIEEIKNQLIGMGFFGNILTYKEYDLKISGKLLGRNNNLYEKKTNDKCLIIGNGPSLKKHNLLHLNNYDSIVVNHAYRVPDIIKINPTFWMLADPLFWIKSDLLLKPIYNFINTNKLSSSLIMNANALCYLKPESVDMEFSYFYDMSLGLVEDEIISCDFSSLMQSCAQNVLCPSILLALYLGYKKIYLAGFDHSWWAFSEQDILNNKMIPHIYNHSAIDERMTCESYEKLGYEGLQQTIARQRLEYKAINKFAKNRGVDILNISSGELSVFDRDEFFLIG